MSRFEKKKKKKNKKERKKENGNNINLNLVFFFNLLCGFAILIFFNLFFVFDNLPLAITFFSGYI